MNRSRKSRVRRACMCAFLHSLCCLHPDLCTICTTLVLLQLILVLLPLASASHASLPIGKKCRAAAAEASSPYLRRMTTTLPAAGPCLHPGLPLATQFKPSASRNFTNSTSSSSSTASGSNNSATSSSASRSYFDSSSVSASVVSRSYLNSTSSSSSSSISSCVASCSHNSSCSSSASAASSWHHSGLRSHFATGLGRLHSSATVAFLSKGVRDLLDPVTDIESAEGAPGAVTLVLDDGVREEQQQEVADVLESLSFSTDRSSSNLNSKQISRQSRAEAGAPRKKVDRWVNPAVRQLNAAKRAEQRGEAFPRGEEAVLDGARFTTSAVPLVSAAGARYQRLLINLDLQLYWARVLRQKGRQEQAVALLKQCIRDWPDDGRPYVALGTLLRKSGMVQEARKVFEDGCQAVRGENPYIWQAWAVLEDRTGNIGKARKLFDAATAADQTHPAAWQGWAHLELREGNSKKARALLKKGLKYHGPNEYLLQTLALIDVRMGRYEQARSSFAKATRANPKSAASWLAWARMEASQERKTTARNLFKSGVEASPKNRYVWQAWALFEAKEGNKERARQLFQRGQQLNPVDPVIYQSYGLFEYDCGNVDIARTLFKRGVAVGPQHQPAWIAWAWVEWKEVNLDVARELFQRAITIDPRSMDAVRSFQAWGILEDREGNVGVARVLFKRALRVDSQNVPTWMSWAAMEERQGNAVRADELRNLCLQQRTEIVDQNPWDVNLENMLAPAIDKLRDFLKLEQRFPWSKEQAKPMDERTVGNLEALEASSRLEEEFDVDAFLGEKFSERYGIAAGQPRQESKVAIRRQQRLNDNEIT